MTLVWAQKNGCTCNLIRADEIKCLDNFQKKMLKQLLAWRGRYLEEICAKKTGYLMWKDRIFNFKQSYDFDCCHWTEFVEDWHKEKNICKNKKIMKPIFRPNKLLPFGENYLDLGSDTWKDIWQFTWNSSLRIFSSEEHNNDNNNPLIST